MFPAAFLLSAGYTSFAALAVGRWRALSRAFMAVSSIVILLQLGEMMLFSRLGVLSTRAKLGPPFEVLHAIAFYLTPPAVVNLIVLPAAFRRRVILSTVIGFVSCFVVIIHLVFFNVWMSEILYGVDGVGGPYPLP